MSSFEEAVRVVLKHEGGLVNDRVDPGGITNFGVSLRFALAELKIDLDGDGFLDGDFDRDGDVDADDIRKMSVEDAKRVYRVHWWERYRYDRLNLQPIANKVLDTSVNMGGSQCHRLVQRACVAMGKDVKVDGILGPGTVGAVNSLPWAEFLDELRNQQKGFYLDLIAKKPAMVKYKTGWLNRAKS